MSAGDQVLVPVEEQELKLACMRAQAERDILHRNSLEAARRNSFSADAEGQRPDMHHPFAGLLPLRPQHLLD